MLRRRLQRRSYYLKRKLSYLSGPREATPSSQRRGEVKHVHNLHQNSQQRIFHFRLTANRSQHKTSLHRHYVQRLNLHSSVVKVQPRFKDGSRDILLVAPQLRTFSTLLKNVLKRYQLEARKSVLSHHFANKLTEKRFRSRQLQVQNHQTLLTSASSWQQAPSLSFVPMGGTPQERVSYREGSPITHLLQKNFTIDNHQKNEFVILQKQLFEKIDSTFVTVKQDLYQENAVNIVHHVKNQIQSRSGEIAKDVLRELQRSSRVESMRRGW